MSGRKEEVVVVRVYLSADEYRALRSNDITVQEAVRVKAGLSRSPIAHGTTPLMYSEHAFNLKESKN